MTAAVSHPALSRELQAFVEAEVGVQARVTGLRDADGHAGLTFLFAVEHAGDVKHYVLRLPPRGVRRKGNTDVYRQAPLLRALHAAGLPVPAICWASPEEGWFGLPFIIMERLPGRTFLMWDPDPAFDRSEVAVAERWEQGARLLADLHGLDWEAALEGWSAPRALADEITFWRPMYQRAPETAWATAASEVESLLLGSLPSRPPIGLVHGDYQLGNILFDAGRPVGIIDWELAHIGAQTLDLGWLMMMADPAIWGAEAAFYPRPLARLVDIYAQATQRNITDAFWYEALAAYRFGSIACLNVKLHRKGQREDPLWEHIAHSVPTLFERAREILSE